MSVVPVTSAEAGDGEVDDRARDVDRLADAMEPGDALEHIGGERRVGESAAAVPGVRMNVGAIALTLMPWRPHSTARQRVRCATAALRGAIDRLRPAVPRSLPAS